MTNEQFAALDAKMEELEDLLKNVDAFGLIPMSGSNRQWVEKNMRRAEALAEMVRIDLAACLDKGPERKVGSHGCE